MAPTITGTRPVSLDELRPHPENDRIGDVDRVMRSLLVNQQYRPVVVQESTGTVLAGNHVVTGCRRLHAGDEPPLPDGYDDETSEDYSPVLVEALERFRAAGWPNEVMSTLVDCTDDEARGILAADNHTADAATYDPARSLDLARALDEAGYLAAATWDLASLDDMQAALEEAAATSTGTLKDRTLEDYAESYEASGTRSIVIFLGAVEYQEVQELLSGLRKRFGVDSNTEVMVRLLRDAAAEIGGEIASG